MIASIDRLFTSPMQRDPLGAQRRQTDMSGANGADIGQVVAMLQDVIAMQRDTRLEIAELRKEMRSVEVRHSAQLDELGGQLASLREELASYHGSVVGHGMLISELDGRVDRIERHLYLPPIE